MTVWAPSSINTFASQAGFTGKAKVLAVAIALAASSGDDAYHYEYAEGTGIQYVGLFGIPAALIPERLIGNLYDPKVNANLAFQLWRSDSGTWDWSPYYASGVWRQFSSIARESATATAAPQSVSTVSGVRHGVSAQSSARLSTKGAVGAMVATHRAIGSVPSRF